MTSIVIGLAIIGIVYWVASYIKKMKVRANEILSKIVEVNQQLGTNFPADASALKNNPLVFGTYNSPTGMIFDKEKCKVLTIAGSQVCVHDYDYIDRWSFEWSEVSKVVLDKPVIQQSDPHFIIGTTDLVRPTLRVNVASMQDGRDWNQRLAVLLGR